VRLNTLEVQQEKHPPDVTLKSQIFSTISSNTALEPGVTRELALFISINILAPYQQLARQHTQKEF
jgi:hypothetical protein